MKTILTNMFYKLEKQSYAVILNSYVFSMLTFIIAFYYFSFFSILSFLIGIFITILQVVLMLIHRKVQLRKPYLDKPFDEYQMLTPTVYYGIFNEPLLSPGFIDDITSIIFTVFICIFLIAFINKNVELSQKSVGEDVKE